LITNEYLLFFEVLMLPPIAVARFVAELLSICD